MNKQKNNLHFQRFGCISMAISILIGAFGAHGAKQILSEASIVTLKTANTYHMMHSLAFIIFSNVHSILKSVWAPRFWALGLCLFSISGYVYSFFPIKIFAHLMPVGGLCFVFGWLSWGFGKLNSQSL